MNDQVFTNNSVSNKATLGSYMVGAYLFSVAVFSYSIDLSLNFIPQWFGILVVLYAVLDFVRTKKLNVPGEIWLYGIFVLWLIITTAIAGVLNDDDFMTLMKVAIVTLSVTQLIKSERDFYNALFIYGTSVFLVVYLNLETLMYLRFALDWMSGLSQFDGTLANANVAAMYALSIVWLSFLLLTQSKSTNIIKFLCLSFMSTALYILYFSGSKKGMISVGLFAIFVAWLVLKRYRFSFLQLFASLLVGTSIVVSSIYYIYTSPFFYRLESMVHLRQFDSSFGSRLYLFNAAIELWLDNVKNIILGIGHNNFINYNAYGAYSHSTISEVLVSSGIIGFGFYFSSLCLLLKNVYAQTKKTYNLPTFAPTMNCLIFLIIVFFFNTTAVLYSARDLWPLIGMVGAFSMSLQSTYINYPSSASGKQ